jgi:hypothetical protein
VAWRKILSCGLVWATSRLGFFSPSLLEPPPLSGPTTHHGAPWDFCDLVCWSAGTAPGKSPWAGWQLGCSVAGPCRERKAGISRLVLRHSLLVHVTRGVIQRGRRTGTPS